MNIEIINIGDEILIGQVINTNAAWLAEELNKAGYRANRFVVLPDTREGILAGLKEAAERADVVLVSGGLGPTKDDITKQTICEFFDTKLVFNQEAYNDIEVLFGKRGWRNISELNRKQAELPETCISLPNYIGTARGMWLETGGQANKEHLQSQIFNRQSSIFIFLPGVPFELKEMFTREVLPRLQRLFPPKAIFHKTILTQGMGESAIAEILHDWETLLPPHIKLAYLPQPGLVRLRLTAIGPEKNALEHEIRQELSKLHALIPDLIFGYDNDTLEAVIGSLLLSKQATLALAESCTGGYIAHLITSVPGSSAWFKGGIIAYANEAKKELLYVKPETLSNHGAVSEQTALEMAAGARTRFGTDYVIATTGIAGPDGGTSEKPVGTVWIAVATPQKIFARHFLFGDDRGRNIRRTALSALNLLRLSL